MRRPHLRRDRVLRYAAAAVAAAAAAWAQFASSPAQAQTYTWTGDGEDNKWSSAGNWFPQAMPPSTADVVFGSGFLSGNPDMAGSRTVNSLNIDTTGFFSLGGSSNPLIITSGRITRLGTSTGTQTLLAPANLSNNGTWTMNGAGAFVVSGAINGNANLAKEGTGTLVLGGGASDTIANSFSGNLIVNGGTVILNKADGVHAIGTSATVNNGGHLVLARSNQLLSGQGVNLNNGGFFDTAGFNQTVGVVVGGGTVNIGGGGTLTLNTNGIDFFAGAFTGSGNFVKSGSGTVTFGFGATDTVASTLSCMTSVNGGSLILNKAAGTNAIGGNLTISGTGNVHLNRSDQIADTAVVTINGGSLDLGSFNETIGGLAGSGGSINSASANLSISPQGNNSYSGTVNALTSDLNVAGGGTQTFSGTGSFRRVFVTGSQLNFSGGSFAAVGPATPVEMQISGGTFALSGGAVFTGTGSFSFSNMVSVDGAALVDGSGTQWHAGPIEIGTNGEGSLTVQNSGSLTADSIDVSIASRGQMLVQSGGRVDAGGLGVGGYAGNTATLTVTGAGSRVLAGSIYFTTNSEPGVANVLNGGTVLVTGTTNFAAASDVLNVNGGSYTTAQLNATAGGTISLSDPSGGAALTIGGGAASSTFSGVIVNSAGGPGSITKVGSDTLTIGGGSLDTAANTYTLG